MSFIILLTLLTAVPDNLQPWYYSCSQGDWEAALNEAADTYLADSTDTGALAALVIAAALEGNYDSGVSLAAETLLSDSSSSLSSAALGALSFADSAPAAAEILLLRAIELDPGNVMAWYLSGLLNAESGSTEPALDCFREALSIDPDFLPARLELSRIQRNTEQYDEALEGFRSMMTIDSPAGMLAMAECILLMESTGELADLDSLENVITNADYSARLYFADIFLELKEYRRAISISLDLLETSMADRAEVLRILGTAYYGNNEISRAEETFDKLLDMDPVSVQALLYLGNIAEQKARTEDAVDYYLRILEIDASNSDARSQLRVIADDSYDPEYIAGSSKGFNVSTSADFSVERGNRALFEWGGSASISYVFDRRGTSIDAAFGGRSVTWEENYGLKKDTLNTNRGWASLGFDYWFGENYYAEIASDWDRQMYTERPWQISSYCAVGWQKWIMSWLWFSPKVGLGSVNARWTSGTSEAYTSDFAIFTAAGLRYRKPHTFIREAEISGNLYFPPDNPENFISHGSISLAFRTWSPLYIKLGYTVDYTRSPEIATWKKFDTSFSTSINLDLF